MMLWLRSDKQTKNMAVMDNSSFWLSETIQISSETTMHRNSSFPMDRRNHMAVMCKSGFWLAETKDLWFSPPPPESHVSLYS